ncbi:hypothetical protein BY996DRAFT_6585215, partial [Phakopsora pachyrhizi]
STRHIKPQTLSSNVCSLSSSPIILVGPYLFIIFASPSDNAPTLKTDISTSCTLPSGQTNHAGLSQWDCQLEDGKYNQMDQYSNLYSSRGLQVQPQTRTHNQSPKLKEHSNLPPPGLNELYETDRTQLRGNLQKTTLLNYSQDRQRGIQQGSSS